MAVESTDQQVGALEKPKDAGEGAEGVVKRWKLELERAGKAEQKWRDDAMRTIAVYRNDAGDEHSVRAQFNILYSNTQTILPAVFQSLPRPDVRVRSSDSQPPQPPMSADPGALMQFQSVMQAFMQKAEMNRDAKAAADIIERGLTYAIDSYDLEGSALAALLDYALTGRGTGRIRYKPVMTQVQPPVPVAMQFRPDSEEEYYADEQGNEYGVEAVKRDQGGGSPYVLGKPEDRLAFEEVYCEHVEWDDFRLSPARKWSEVRWVAFRTRLTREELIEEFGAVGATIPLTEEPKDEGIPDDAKDTFKRAVIWEIWDKPSRKQLFICPDYPTAPLRDLPDPLGLQGFFPVPKPMYSVPLTGRLTPYPEYLIYEDEAKRLDEATKAIGRMMKRVRLRGVYDKSYPELASILAGEDGTMIPTQNYAQMMQGGGLEAAVAFVDIKPVLLALERLQLDRAEIKNTIFEMIGLADIMRGTSDPAETLGAQDKKERWGALRIDSRRREVQRWLRDLFRMMGEVMAEKFQPMTLELMTGIKPTPQVLSILRSDGLRSFRIDVETDVAADLQQDREDITQLLESVVTFIQGVAPAVQSGALSIDAAKAMLLAAVRRYRLGREVEDAINQIGAGTMQPPAVAPGLPGAAPAPPQPNTQPPGMVQ